MTEYTAPTEQILAAIKDVAGYDTIAAVPISPTLTSKQSRS